MKKEITNTQTKRKEDKNMEEMILKRQEDNITDDCLTCPYKEKCNNQCMEVEEHYNPNLKRKED